MDDTADKLQATVIKYGDHRESVEANSAEDGDETNAEAAASVAAIVAVGAVVATIIFKF
ncbi:MAG: hypothetical protein GY874_05680 [Desulfobacteraceae bacterium]|nr:hypothetical protein [Desulfobacteraceae bacterium]